MAALWNSIWTKSLLLLFMVGICSPVCVEVPPGTEAVKGENMTLLCISCMKREEVYAVTNVKWFYQPNDKEQELLIFEYDRGPMIYDSPMKGRLHWNGSKDLQDVSITLHNVRLNDSGVFTCNVTRILHFDSYRHSVQSNVSINLRVTEEAGEDFTSVLSEIVMYVLLAFLTFWLLVEIVYCYRKISKAEEVTQESITDYLAIPSENKENCAVPVEE
ncbi:sodium channel subunit beta-3 [Bombina bombina]|uniref:sodium channel subunit beta-3 n=1 Tax=Bombina bombina TaxID=8345 RepID=UPI00235A8F59|nr:sodium channel subunit beta-3 [Bombina bombina]